MDAEDWMMDLDMETDWVPEPQPMPYWRWLCGGYDVPEHERAELPLPSAERLCGEMLAALLDRMRPLEIDTESTVAAFADLAAALRGCEAGIDPLISGMTEGERISSTQAERIGRFAHTKAAIERVERFAALLAACERDEYAELQALSGGLLHDLARLRQDLDCFGFDAAPLMNGWAGVQRAVRHLLSEYKDYLLRTYTDYFDDRTPTDAGQLGGMLIGAAILEGIAEHALAPSPERRGRGGSGLPLPIEPQAYKTLLDWFDDYHHYEDWIVKGAEAE